MECAATRYCEQIDGGGGISAFIEESEAIRLVSDRDDNYIGCVVLRRVGYHTVYIDSVRREVYADDGADFCRTGMKEEIWRELDELLTF